MGETYFLSSLDSRRFMPVRRCDLGPDVDFDTGKRAVVARIEPPVLGQDFGRPADIDSVILTTRHAGASLRPIDEFPCFVHIAIATEEDQPVVSPLSAADLTIIGWGELYRTAEDAEANRFD